MAKCKYIIQLPGGEKIELPASFSTLTHSAELKKLFETFQDSTSVNKKEEILKDLSEFIAEQLPKEIPIDTVVNIITTSENLDELYDKFDTIVLNLGTYDRIESAIRNYIRPDKTKGTTANKNLIELKKKLSKPNNPKYFESYGLTGVIGASNLNYERNRIMSKNWENEEFGFPTLITSNLKTVLNAVIAKYPDTKFNNILYGTKSPFVGKAWSSDDIILYDLNDDLALFLGVFKREAMKLNPKKLLAPLTKINEVVKNKMDLSNFDITTFFNGNVDNKRITPSTFETLLNLADNAEIAKQLDNIFQLVAESIDPKNLKLSKSIKILFWQLSPDTYGKNSLFKQLEDIKLISEESEKERQYKENRLSFLDMDTNVRDLNYAPKEVIVDDIYNNAVKNIERFKDIVKFPAGSTGVYALVTNIFQREDKVIIYGIYKNQFGQIESIDHVFGAGEITYRKRENPVDEFNPDEMIVKTNGTLITSTTPMTPKLVKQLIRKGDMINGNIVMGVYPSFIYVKTPKGNISQVFYNNITSFYSSKILSELDLSKKIDINKFVVVNDGEDLSVGDYFLFEKNGKKFYKRILYADRLNVYSWVEKAGKDLIIAGTPRKGLKGLHDAFGELTGNEIDKIKKETSAIGRSKATMSSFTNKAKVRKGDLFTFTDGKIIKFGKVLEDNKVIINVDKLTNRMVISIDKLPNVPITFFTNRDISSNYSFFTIRANNYLLEFKKEIENKSIETELRYVIPKNTDLSKFETLTNGYGNIGTYKEIGSITEDDIDVTKELLKALGHSPDTLVIGKKESSTSNRFERNLEGLTWVKYFNALDKKTKLDLGIIAPGTYFSMYNSKDIDWNIYRVISVNDNLVRAHLNKTSSTGDIITTEIEVPIDVLLADKVDALNPVGSIARLYVQHGNSKMKAVLNEVNNLSGNNNQTKPATAKAIGKLINKLKNHIKDLNIDVKLVPAKNNFSAGQKAKIQTKEDGTTEILINEEIGQTEDVIHEFLHLFLTPLRYRYPDVYYNLIQSIVKNPDLNVTDAEEIFVNFVSAEMSKQNDFINNFEDLQTFVTGIQTIITDLTVDFEISKEDNPITLLNTPLMDLFGIDKNDDSNPLYNLSMITTEPLMREWMKNNNITLNCS